MDLQLFLENLRATAEPIDNIIRCFITLANKIFNVTSSGALAGSSWMYQLVSTIMSNQYLLVGLALLVCGFVIGLLERMIKM